MFRARTAFPYFITTPPDSAEVDLILPLDDVKQWLEIPTAETAEDAKLAIMISNVLAVAQEMTERVFITTAFRTLRDSFSVNHSVIELRKSPFNALSTFRYYSSGSLTDVPAASYYIDESEDYSSIFRADGYTWPVEDDRAQAIEVVFTAGYDSAALLHAAYPALKAALLAHVAAVYTNRGDCDVSCDACRSKAPSTAQIVYNQMKIAEMGAVGGSRSERSDLRWV